MNNTALRAGAQSANNTHRAFSSVWIHRSAFMFVSIARIGIKSLVVRDENSYLHTWYSSFKRLYYNSAQQEVKNA